MKDESSREDYRDLLFPAMRVFVGTLEREDIHEDIPSKPFDSDAVQIYKSPSLYDNTLTHPQPVHTTDGFQPHAASNTLSLSREREHIISK